VIIPVVLIDSSVSLGDAPSVAHDGPPTTPAADLGVDFVEKDYGWGEFLSALKDVSDLHIGEAKAAATARRVVPASFRESLTSSPLYIGLWQRPAEGALESRLAHLLIPGQAQRRNGPAGRGRG
jgi:hypothetical protein